MMGYIDKFIAFVKHIKEITSLWNEDDCGIWATESASLQHMLLKDRYHITVKQT